MKRKEKTLKIKSCVDCPHHDIVPDPDPTDSFCDDDVAVLCKKMLPHKKDQVRWHDSKPFPHRVLTVSCRPYQVEIETTPIPDWCPL